MALGGGQVHEPPFGDQVDPTAVLELELLDELPRLPRLAGELDRKVYPVPPEIDREIARLKLATMGVEIDTLTEEQARYLASWDEGT